LDTQEQALSPCVELDGSRQIELAQEETTKCAERSVRLCEIDAILLRPLLVAGADRV
jgi:hypothetical protein